MSEFLDLVGGFIKLAFVVAIVLGGLALWGHNKLRRLSENVKEAASNIKVAIGKKTQLINDLTALVLRYHEDEKLVMLKVSEDATVSSLQNIYHEAGTVLAKIEGVAQRFPELRSNQQFGRLMTSVQESENGIQAFRIQYNSVTKSYNVHRGSFPQVFFASSLGFNAGQYLDFDSFSPLSGQQAPVISDDGERMRQLVGTAGAKALEATRTLAHHGRTLAERAAAKVQAVGSADLGGEFTYLDESQAPQGPVSREELDSLFRARRITTGTKILRTGSKQWVTYGEL